jgi:type II secretory pathway pseudopilin PulG
MTEDDLSRLKHVQIPPLRAEADAAAFEAAMKAFDQAQAGARSTGDLSDVDDEMIGGILRGLEHFPIPPLRGEADAAAFRAAVKAFDGANAATALPPSGSGAHGAGDVKRSSAFAYHLKTPLPLRLLVPGTIAASLILVVIGGLAAMYYVNTQMALQAEQAQVASQAVSAGDAAEQTRRSVPRRTHMHQFASPPSGATATPAACDTCAGADDEPTRRPRRTHVQRFTSPPSGRAPTTSFSQSFGGLTGVGLTGR